MNGITYCILMITVCVLAAFKSMKRSGESSQSFYSQELQGYHCFLQCKKKKKTQDLYLKITKGGGDLFIYQSVKNSSRTITKCWRHPPGLKTSQIWIWLSSGAVPEQNDEPWCAVGMKGFSLSETMFGFLLWVHMNTTTRGSPLEHCALATISVTFASSVSGFNVWRVGLEDWSYSMSSNDKMKTFKFVPIVMNVWSVVCRPSLTEHVVLDTLYALTTVENNGQAHEKQSISLEAAQCDASEVLMLHTHRNTQPHTDYTLRYS